MVYDNISNKIKKVKVKAMVKQIFGWSITGFCGLLTIAMVCSYAQPSDIIVALVFAFFTFLGIRLIIKGRRIIKQIKRYYDYYARLSADPEKSMELLASSTGETVEGVTKNISEMIAFGFFPGTFLDTAHNRLVVQNVAPCGVGLSSAADDTNFVTVQCKGCGATNKILAGSVGECEFCGSQISEK